VPEGRAVWAIGPGVSDERPFRSAVSFEDRCSLGAALALRIERMEMIVPYPFHAQMAKVELEGVFSEVRLYGVLRSCGISVRLHRSMAECRRFAARATLSRRFGR
jgi:hypothetical protein